MKYKNAQFYIIAAVIIAVIIASLVTVVNYINTQQPPTKFYDLSKQLEQETSKLINYGVVSGSLDINQEVNNFIQSEFWKYAKEKEPGIELVYIYGNEASATLVNLGKNPISVSTPAGTINISGAYETVESSISIDLGGGKASKKIVQEKSAISNFFVEKFGTKKVTLIISGYPYEFDLTGDQQFFAILKTRAGNETYVSET